MAQDHHDGIITAAIMNIADSAQARKTRRPGRACFKFQVDSCLAIVFFQSSREMHYTDTGFAHRYSWFVLLAKILQLVASFMSNIKDDD
jgi:hypothetical protein